MTEIEKQIQNLLVAIVRMEKTQESTIEGQKTTTENVEKLVQIIKNDTCTKGHCKDLSNRMEKVEEDIDAIKSLPNKILWRVGIVVLTIVAVATLANLGINTSASEKEDNKIKELEATISKLQTNQIRNYERYKLEKEYKVKLVK